MKKVEVLAKKKDIAALEELSQGQVKSNNPFFWWREVVYIRILGPYEDLFFPFRLTSLCNSGIIAWSLETITDEESSHLYIVETCASMGG